VAVPFQLKPAQLTPAHNTGAIDSGTVSLAWFVGEACEAKSGKPGSLARKIVAPRTTGRFVTSPRRGSSPDLCWSECSPGPVNLNYLPGEGIM
jgi:hypothetical protein